MDAPLKGEETLLYPKVKSIKVKPCWHGTGSEPILNQYYLFIKAKPFLCSAGAVATTLATRTVNMYDKQTGSLDRLLPGLQGQPSQQI